MGKPKTLKVYRVEHPDTGDGPYGGEHIMHGIHAEHANSEHPSPWEDSNPVHNLINQYSGHDHLRHGFDSLAKLDEWFANWHDRMDAKGFVIAAYETPLGSYRKGKQVLFWRHKAKLVETITLKGR